MHHQTNRIHVTEDGEAIGTLRQFSTSFGLPQSDVLACVQDDAEDAIILNAGSGQDRVLIVDPEALDALSACTPRRSSAPMAAA